MSKKKPIKNSDPSINFRLPKELKASIEEKAQEKNQTSSAYLRDLLESVFNGDYCYKEQVKDRIESVIYSKDFLQLMVWIYRKRENRKQEVTDQELNRYIRALKKLDGHLPQNITDEFDKVLNDILIVKTEQAKYFKEFKFHSTYEKNKQFNLELVEKFLLDDAKLNQFINIKGVKNIEVPDLKGFKFPNLEQN